MLVIRTILTFACVLCLLGASAAAESATAAIPDGGELRMTLPDAWRATTEVAGPSVTARIATAEPQQFLVLLTVLPVKPGSAVGTPEGLKALVTQLGNNGLASALQDQLELSELTNPEGPGFYYHLTDRKPESGPADYREAHQGALLLATHIVSFTVLTHPGDDKTVEQAVRLLTSLRIVLPASRT